jgi:hypothetical protein
MHFLARGRDKRDEKKKKIIGPEFTHLLDTDNMTGFKMKLKLLKIPKTKKLARPSSFRPPIGPGTQADHGVDSTALLPGCMWNRFRPFCCSGVSGR